MPDGCVTIREAAKRLGAGRETVKRWIRTGKLAAVPVVGSKHGAAVPVAEVDRLLREGVPL